VGSSLRKRQIAVEAGCLSNPLGLACLLGCEHRYRFRLYVRVPRSAWGSGATLVEVEAAIADHVPALSELVGTYSR